MRVRKHARGDGVLLREEAVHQDAPCLGVLAGVAGNVADSPFNLAMYADDVAFGKRVRERNLGFDQFIAVEQTQFVRDRREVRQLISARVKVRPKTGQGFLFGYGHAANGVILFEDKNLQPRPGEIARARQTVVSRPDNDSVVRMRHSEDKTRSASGARSLTFVALSF